MAVIIHISHPVKQHLLQMDSLYSLSLSRASGGVSTWSRSSSHRRCSCEQAVGVRRRCESVSRHPPLRMNASPHRCRHGNTGPTRAVAPGPPGTLAFQGPERGNSELPGGCRKQRLRGAARPTRSREPVRTGGTS